MRTKYIRKNYSPEVCAYLAGILDGEGCIHVGCFRKITSYRKSPHFQTYINVSNTSEVLIDWLHNTFGGAKRKYTPRQTPLNSRKPVYLWCVWSEQLEHICELVLPYVVIKKREVELMLEMRATFKGLRWRKKACGILPVREEILARREEILQELKSLHQRK